MLDATPGQPTPEDTCSRCNPQQSTEVSGQLLFPFAEASEEFPHTDGFSPAEIAVFNAHMRTIDIGLDLSNVVRDTEPGEGRPG